MSAYQQSYFNLGPEQLFYITFTSFYILNTDLGSHPPYFAKHNKENTLNLNESILQPAKLHLTITKAGEITNARLDRTSGYPEIDKTMIDLLTQTQGKWVAAKNAQGEKVDQELVITFGMVGC